jgi:hypothetical protein
LNRRLGEPQSWWGREKPLPLLGFRLRDFSSTNLITDFSSSDNRAGMCKLTEHWSQYKHFHKFSLTDMDRMAQVLQYMLFRLQTFIFNPFVERGWNNTFLVSCTNN